MQQEVHELVDEDQMESGDGDSEILQDKDSEETIPEVEDSKGKESVFLNIWLLFNCWAGNHTKSQFQS